MCCSDVVACISAVGAVYGSAVAMAPSLGPVSVGTIAWVSLAGNDGPTMSISNGSVALAALSGCFDSSGRRGWHVFTFHMHAVRPSLSAVSALVVMSWVAVCWPAVVGAAVGVVSSSVAGLL